MKKSEQAEAGAEIIRPFESKVRNTVGRALHEARKAKGMTLDGLSAALAERGYAVRKSALSKWESGETVPNAYQLLAACDILNIATLARLRGSETLSAAGLRKVDEYARDLAASGLYAPEPVRSAPAAAPAAGRAARLVRMPVYEQAASAGTGDYLDDDSYEMCEFSAADVPPRAAFAVRIQGDSMEPAYHSGELAWVCPCDTLRRGQVGIFVVNGDAFIKQYSEQLPEDPEPWTDSEGSVHMQPVLISLNTAYAPIAVPPDAAFRTVGRVLN